VCLTTLESRNGRPSLSQALAYDFSVNTKEKVSDKNYIAIALAPKNPSCHDLESVLKRI